MCAFHPMPADLGDTIINLLIAVLCSLVYIIGRALVEFEHEYFETCFNSFAR